MNREEKAIKVIETLRAVTRKEKGMTVEMKTETQQGFVGFHKCPPTMRGLWIKVEDELPKDFEVVLVYCNTGDMRLVKYNKYFRTFISYKTDYEKSVTVYFVTHWLRPELPEERK